MLTSHLLIKVGFLDSNLLRTFGVSNEVSFGWSLARFKALEVSYNFPKNSLLRKCMDLYNSQNTPRRSKLPKIKFFQIDPKTPSCIFSSQTPSKLSWNHKNFRVWSFILKIHQVFKKRNLPFLVWNDHFVLSVIFSLFA